MDAIVLGVDHDHRWRSVILDREVEHFCAGLAWGHRADADVIAPAPAAGGDHVPGRRFQTQFDAKLVRHRFGNVDIETVELILLIEKREGWIAFHEHADQFFFLLDAVQRRAAEGLGGGQNGQAQGQ